MQRLENRLGTRGRQEAEAMRRIIEDQRKRILARKEEVKRNEAQLTLGFDKMELQQMEEERLRNMLDRIQKGNIIITFPKRLTPFCFPIKVDSMREDLSSEKLEERVKRMQMQLEK